MATTKFLAPCDSSTLANFLAWGQALSNGLVSAGLVRTANTGQYGGQANWAAVTLPGAGNSIYEMLAFNDSSQGTSPLYVKVTYGRGAANQALIEFSVGTGTDGAGTLTGGLSGICSTSVSLPTASTTLYACYVNGAAGWFNVLMWRDYTSQTSVPYGFMTERGLNTSGQYIDSYTYVAGCTGSNAGNGSLSIVVMKPGGAFAQTTREYRAPAALPYGNVSGIYDGSILLTHPFPLYGQVANRQTAIGFAKFSDTVEGAYYQCTIYGTTLSYVCSKNGPQDNSTGGLIGDGYTATLYRIG